MSDFTSGKAPWHFWTISGLSLLWNAFGGYDYTMTKLRNMDYLTQMAGSPKAAQAMLAAIDDLPAWTTALWAVGVWASLLGSILLLLRSRHAAAAFLASLIGAAISFAYQFAMGVPADIGTPAGLAMIIVILTGIVFQWWYSRRSAGRGILR